MRGAGSWSCCKVGEGMRMRSLFVALCSFHETSEHLCCGVHWARQARPSGFQMCSPGLAAAGTRGQGGLLYVGIQRLAGAHRHECVL